MVLAFVGGARENLGVQGSSGPDRELLDAAAFVSHLVPENSMYAFLAEHRQRLFPERVAERVVRRSRRPLPRSPVDFGAP